METKRLEEIINELLSYTLELRTYEDTEERIKFFKECIGMTKEEIKYFSIV